VIRLLRPEDSNAIYEIIDESHGQPAAPLGPRWTKSQTESECGGLGWVLLGSSGEMKAFVLYRDLGEAFEITFLATAINARGQGCMVQLIKHLIQQKSREKPVWLEVHEQNEPARRLYRKIGFQEVGKRARYYSDGGSAVLYNYG
jgi:[ribosomal protein S18]-alanine N-acetyltransferase